MKPAPRVTLSIALALALAAGVSPVGAKSRAGAGNNVQAGVAASDLDPAPVARLAAEVDQAETTLDAASLNARSPRLTDADLRARLAAVPSIKAKLAAALDELTPRLQSTDARLAQLGPAPALGQAAEDPEITKSRQEIQGYRRSVDTEVKQAHLLETEADQLASYLTARRRELFSARVWVRGRSALDASLWRDFAFAAPRDAGRVQAVIGQDLRLAQARAMTSGGVAALLVALVLLAPARMLLNRLGERRLAASPAGALGAPAIALWWVLVAGMTPWLAGLAMQGALSTAGALTPEFGRLLTLLIGATVFAALFEGLGRALLAQGHADWRLAPIPDPVAERLAPYPALIGLSAGLAYLVAGANAVLGLSRPTSEASQCLAILLEIGAVGSSLATLGRARGAQLPIGDDVLTSADGSRAPWILTAVVAWVSLVGAIAALVLGYVALAGLILRELVWVAMVLAALFLLMRFVDELFPTLLSPQRAVGRSLRLAIGLSAAALEQSAELVTGLVRLALLLCAWLAVIAPLGAGADEVFGRVTSADLVIQLGQLSISPGAVAGAVLVFALGLVATRTLRRWLETRYLPKTRMDVGVRLSMASAVTYLGGLIAFVFTCSYLGVSLDRIALLASALSVGIGFGLQAVIGNFVSGLVLLAERPVKVGDWIAIGDLEGDVTRISVRATEIEMRDRSKLIVPNSELISKTVRNVTRGGSLGRVKIVLLVENGADPGVVRDLLLERLTSHPATLADPPAAVYLTDVRDGALEMTAFAYLSSPRQVFNAKSDLLFAIVLDLKARGIGLASSSAVVNVGFPDRPIEPDAGPRRAG